MSTIGQIIAGKYELVDQLGEGGMGTVFAARNTWTGKRVAIKVLHPEFSHNEELVQRFVQEARAASRVEHPNIVNVIDMGVDPDGGFPFIVQELLQGESLEELLQAAPNKRLDPEAAVRILLPVAAALVAAHRVGIVHRDLKPANIFMARTLAGKVVPKVIDFGISKILESADPSPFTTRNGLTLGSPAYMSPEQARGDANVDGRSDVWSLGVVLFEMLTGKTPIEAEHPNLMLARVIYERPARIEALLPDLPADLVAIVHSALEPNLAKRFGSMRLMLHALRRCSVLKALPPSDTPSWEPSPRMSVLPDSPRAISPSRAPTLAALVPAPPDADAPQVELTDAVWVSSPQRPSDAVTQRKAPLRVLSAAFVVGALALVFVSLGVGAVLAPSHAAVAVARPAPATPVVTAVHAAAPLAVAPPAPAPEVIAPVVHEPAPTVVVAHRHERASRARGHGGISIVPSRRRGAPFNPAVSVRLPSREALLGPVAHYPKP